MSLKRKAADAATDAAKKTKVNGNITSFFGAPKPKEGASAPAKFDKEAWVAKLNEEQKELLKLEIDTLHESWLPHLKEVLVSPGFLELKRFLKKELDSGKTVYPPMKDVYSWCVPSNSSHRSRPPLDGTVGVCTMWQQLIEGTGRGTRPSPPSRQSSQAKIPTTTLTKPTAFASPCVRLQPPHLRFATSPLRSRRITRTSRSHRRRAVS